MSQAKEQRKVSAIRKCREARGLTLQQFADQCGVHFTAVHKWELRGVPPERVPAIEAATGIPRHELRPDLWPAPSSAEAA